MDQRLGTFTIIEETAKAGGHGPVVLVRRLKAGQGVLPCGLILAADGDDEGVPYAVITLAAGVGDGAETAFTVDFGGPLDPGTVSLADGVEVFVDDGLGRLVGDAGGTGTVEYVNGTVSATFAAAPAADDPVTATAWPRLVGVLEREVDTASEDAGTYIPHGTVHKGKLKVGVSAGLPTIAQLNRLIRFGVYPV